MRSPTDPWMDVPTKPEGGGICDVLCGLLVLLMMVVPAVLVGMYLHHMCSGVVNVSFTNVDPMLFRMTGLG